MPSDARLAEWNERFSIAGIAEVVTGNGGLPKVCITSPAAAADIYLYGAQVTSWRPAGTEEVLFLSRHSRWEEGRAIRGGIPICFPWFRGKAGNPKAPAHGVVRTQPWQIDALSYEDDSVIAAFSTASNQETHTWSPDDFNVHYRVVVGATLRMELEVHNTGSTTMRFEEALHTYHRVGDIERVRVEGLDGVTYLDNMDHNYRKMQTGAVTFDRQTDSAYMHTSAPVHLVDTVLGRRISTSKENSHTTVVWNPWKQGAASLSDFGNDAWREMACVEASNILDLAVDLEPGGTHRMTATLSVDRLSE